MEEPKDLPYANPNRETVKTSREEPVSVKRASVWSSGKTTGERRKQAEQERSVETEERTADIRGTGAGREPRGARVRPALARFATNLISQVRRDPPRGTAPGEPIEREGTPTVRSAPKRRPVSGPKAYLGSAGFVAIAL